MPRPSLEPTFDLFRTFMRRDDVECPVVAAATVRTPRPAVNNRSNTGTRAAPKPAPRPVVTQAAPKPAAKPTTKFGVGIGLR